MVPDFMGTIKKIYFISWLNGGILFWSQEKCYLGSKGIMKDFILMNRNVTI